MTGEPQQQLAPASEPAPAWEGLCANQRSERPGMKRCRAQCPSCVIWYGEKVEEEPGG